MTAITLHPNVLRHRKRTAELRRELAELIEEYMTLNFEEIPKLRYRYTELFGDLERKIQERTLELSERQRLAELFALKIDRGQPIDDKTVELVLKVVYNEFGDIRRRVQRVARNNERRRMEGGDWMPGIESGTETVSNRSTELRNLYRTLAKRLHPDRQRHNDPVAAQYWDLTQRGYRRGDIRLLRTLINLTGIEGDRHGHPKGADRTMTEAERLSEALQAERSRIDRLRSEEPLSLAKNLWNKEWIAERQKELQVELGGIEQELEKYDGFLAPILSGSGDLPPTDAVRSVWADFVEDTYINNR